VPSAVASSAVASQRDRAARRVRRWRSAGQRVGLGLVSAVSAVIAVTVFLTSERAVSPRSCG
jgi:hypothetical protein